MIESTSLNQQGTSSPPTAVAGSANVMPAARGLVGLMRAMGLGASSQAGSAASTNTQKGSSNGGGANSAMMWNSMLMSEATSVLSGNTQAAASLQQDYAKSQDMRIQLMPAVQQMVEKALSMADGGAAGNQSGANPPANQQAAAQGAPASGGTVGGGSPASESSGGPVGAGSSGGGTLGGGSRGGGSLGERRLGAGTLGGGRSQNLGSLGGGGSLSSSDQSTAGGFTGANYAALNSVLNAPPEQMGNLFTDFAQGKEGNCASVATIKAAMGTYGNQVFDQVTATQNGGYDVRLQDGANVQISGAELNAAAQASNFKGNGNGAEEYATLAFAVMAKREQEQNAGQSYGAALQALDSGQDPRKTAQYLGLENNVRTVDPANLGNANGVVGWNSHHAVYIQSAGNGTEVADHYGQAQTYNGTDTNGHTLTSAFQFVPRTTAVASNNRASTSTPSSARPQASAAVTSSAPRDANLGAAPSAAPRAAGRRMVPPVTGSPATKPSSSMSSKLPHGVMTLRSARKRK